MRGALTDTAVIPEGTPIVWTINHRSRRGKVVAYVPAGTAPADIAPEIRGLNRRRVQFNNAGSARHRAHYLVAREEQKEKLGVILVYYLPDHATVCRSQGQR